METRHTPGPWLVEPINGGQTYQITSAESRHFVVLAETPLDGTGCEDANAHMMAAAPELYEALKSIVQALEIEVEVFGRANDRSRLGIARKLLARPRAAPFKRQRQAVPEKKEEL